MSAHVNFYCNAEAPFARYGYIDLGVAGIDKSLAETSLILGEVLDREIKERIAHELDKRLFTPFLEHNFH